MRVAMIGAGNVGRALAGAAAAAGHQVTLSSGNPERAREAASAAGASAAAGNREAVRDADLVVLAVPAATAVPVVRELGAELDGKVVVDVTNRVDLANPAAVLDGSSNSEAIQAAVPGARVVKAFNTAFASRQADPRAEGVQLDGFVAGDDEAAKAQAMELAASIGFRPVDAGGLAMARVLEGMALLLIGLQVRYEAPWQAGWKVVGPLGRVA